MRSCEIEFADGADAIRCGRRAVAECAECRISLCSGCRTECCGESFCDYCYEYHLAHSCLRKRTQPEEQRHPKRIDKVAA